MILIYKGALNTDFIVEIYDCPTVGIVVLLYSYSHTQMKNALSEETKYANNSRISFNFFKKKNLCQLTINSNNKKVYQKYSRGINILVLGCAGVFSLVILFNFSTFLEYFIIHFGFYKCFCRF